MSESEQNLKDGEPKSPQSERSLRVQVNGETQDLPEGISLDGLVARLGLAPERLAIELNREVVRRAEWPRTTLKEGDRIEIVHFVGGGSGRAEVRRQTTEGGRQ